jgi:membrane protein
MLKFLNTDKIKGFIELIRSTIIDFSKDLPLTHAAAFAYYSLLALVPLLYLSISFFGQFVGHDVMYNIIISLLTDYVGISDLSGITSFLDEVDLGQGSVGIQILGGILLMFSCTAILNALKKSINTFYGITPSRKKQKRKIISSLIFRIISMLAIMAATIVIIVLYFAETVFLSIGNRFFEDMEMAHWIFSSAAQHGVPIILNILIFTFVLKFLNDGVVRWKVAIRGAIITGFLLYLGQLLIKFYLSNYFFASGGGVAGTMLVLLVWVYYSSIIMFLGTKFTAEYGRLINCPITPRD